MKGGTLLISFDDGYKTDFTVALAAMEAKSMPLKATSFICGNYTAEHRLQPTDMKTMISKGWDIQCHTFPHAYDPALTERTEDDVREQLRLNDDFFRTVLNMNPPIALAYPGGAYTEAVKNVVRTYRKLGRTCIEQYFTPYTDKLEIPSFSFDTADIPRLQWIIDTCVKHGLYADIHCHEISAALGNLDKYNAMLDHIKKTGIRLITYTDLYDELQ